MSYATKDLCLIYEDLCSFSLPNVDFRKIFEDFCPFPLLATDLDLC